jgi:phosphate transport system regulatory protein PhoU
MRKILEKELQMLKNLILDMAKSVDEMVHGAILAIDKLDSELAQKVIEADENVDYYEHMVSQTALEIIALQQPVAKDLRFVITAIDIARNLERVADQAVNIAYRVPVLYQNKDIPKCKVEVMEMANEALFMLQAAINAFVTEDTQKARSVIDYDDVVDKFQTENIETLKACMKRNADLVELGVDYIIIVQNLERVADLATNIAESVIFTVEGRMPKFEAEKFQKFHIIKDSLFKDISIFELLKKHAHLVLECMERISLSLEAYHQKDFPRLEEIAKHIFDIEKEADKVKRNIRSHLPKGLILPVERFELFFYLKEQDAIADVAEEILNWLSFKHIELPDPLFESIQNLLNKSLESLTHLEKMISYSTEFLLTRDENSRNQAKEIIREIRYAQYIAEEMGNSVRKEVFQKISEPIALFFTLKLVDLILEIAHHAENTADLMRAMIAR